MQTHCTSCSLTYATFITSTFCQSSEQLQKSTVLPTWKCHTQNHSFLISAFSKHGAHIRYLSLFPLKDKHTQIPGDSELLKNIYRQVEEQLLVDKQQVLFHIILNIIFYFGLSAAGYYSLYIIHTTSLFLLCFIGYGIILLPFAFNFSPDFSHNTIFRSKNLNHLCFTIIYPLVGAHAEAWKKRHVHSHHYAPNVEEYDSDLKITSLIRVTPSARHRWFHRFQHHYAPFLYTTYSLFWIFIKDFIILFSHDQYQEKKNITYHLSFWAQKTTYITYLVILPILFAPHPWYIILTGFLLMHLTQSLFLLFTF